MMAQGISTSNMPRAGFTLLELMLVLVLMVAIGSIAVPRMTDLFERQRLNGAASSLRLVWDEARLEAMRTGQAQVFQCTVGTNEYTIKPLIMQSDMANAGAGAEIMLGGGAVVEAQSGGRFEASEVMTEAGAQPEKLDENINFVSCLVSGDMRAYTVAQNAQTESSGLSEVNTQSVAQQVIFYPDGSTSTAEVQLQNKRGEIRAVRIRGLTGHSQIAALKNVASGTETEAKGVEKETE